MSSATPPLAREVARAAARWLMHLHSGEATTEDVEACRRWRATDPEHERAWQRAERLGEKLAGVPRSSMAALARTHRGSRRQLFKALVVLICAAPAGYAAWRAREEDWIGSVTADHRTATGERRRIQLADGSVVHLNTATAVDVEYGERLRQIVLHQGEILVETAADRGTPAPRPFVVRTAHGRLRALGTRFVVRTEDGASDGATRLTVLEGAVEVRPRLAPETAAIIRAGQQTQLSAYAVAETQPADRHAADWSRGLLIADSMRLADFAAELARHRRGVLRCDPAVARLRITGAFRLDNTDAILAALPDTLPVGVVHRTRWWVVIGAPQR